MNKKEAKKLIEKHPDVAAEIVVAAARFLDSFEKRAFVLTRKMQMEEAMGKGAITAINTLIAAVEKVPVDDPAPAKSKPTQSEPAPQETTPGGTTPSQSAPLQPTS